MSFDDRRLERIELKLDHAADHLNSIDITLTAQNVTLNEHIRRTNLLEKKLAPIEKHVAMLNGVFKFLGIIATIVAITAALHSMLK